MLTKLMNDWGQSFHKQRDLIDIELRQYFAYIKKEFVAFKDVNIF